MKYLVFATEKEATDQAKRVFVGMVRARAQETGGVVEDWADGRKSKAIAKFPDEQIDGARFPLYGKNAKTMGWETKGGMTRAWATPQQIADGRWVIPSHDGSGEDEKPDWWKNRPSVI